MKRSPDGAAVLGEIAAEYDDLNQEIRQCILTPKRSVPLNPEKGCDLDQFRDRPMNVRNLFVVAEIRAALARDVPRVVVHELAVDKEFDALTIQIAWTASETALSDFRTTEVAYVF